jgi:hypothetical protein
MKRFFRNISKQDVILMLTILSIGAIAYLFMAKRLGFYGDDWYLIFDGHTQGPSFFKNVYSSDRPARGLVMYLAYSLFGNRLIFYHISAFLFRFFASIALYWTLNEVWKGKNFTNFLIALFFMIFPGFLSQLQPVDYQSEILSLFLAMVSIALTVKAVQIRRYSFKKILLLLVSVVFGLFYLGLVEYFLGFEFLRFFFILCLVWQDNFESVRQKIKELVVRWLPTSVIPLGILFWFLFVFKSERSATNLGDQAGKFFASPILTGTHWILDGLYSFFNILISTWVIPFYRNVLIADIRLKDIGYVVVLGVIACLIFFLGVLASKRNLFPEQSDPKWAYQAIWGGLLSIAFGILPIIVANRTVTVENDMTRYTLTGAIGSIMVLITGIRLIRHRKLQIGVLTVLLFVIMATHIGNALNYVNQAENFRNFWWQVAWRVPQIKRGSTLIAAYSVFAAPEDYDIWAPANIIYYPEKSDSIPVPIQISAALAYNTTSNLVLGNDNPSYRNEREILVKYNWDSLLVITQPTANNCVRILDNTMPELSPDDNETVKLVGPFSKVEQVLVDSEPANPLVEIFGPEPAHTWCYYYEKITLARQNKDWQSMENLANEALSKGLRPSDRIEYIPFLQAIVASGEIDKLKPYPILMNQFPLIRIQNCAILTQTAVETRPDDNEIQSYIKKNFCPPYPEN